MKARHSYLRLYRPIRELSFVSAYFPSRRARGSGRGAGGRAPPLGRPPGANDCDRGRDGYSTAGEQRAQSYVSAGELLSSCEATKAAVAELRWLAAEHHQLLAELLTLCGDCATRIRMGNQDGKLLDLPEGVTLMPGQGGGMGAYPVGASSLQHPLSPERKKGKSKKLKKLAGKKNESADEFAQSKSKKKGDSGAGLDGSHTKSGKDASGMRALVGDPRSPGSTGSRASHHCPKTFEMGPYPRMGKEPILPMDDDFHISREGWDFMEDSQAFVSGGDLCSELSEYHRQLYLGCGPIASSSFLEEATQGLGGRLGSGSNLRPSSSAPGKSSLSRPAEQSACSEGAVANSPIGLCDRANRRETMVASAATTQQDARTDPKVSPVRTDRGTTLGSTAAGEAAASQPGRESSMAAGGQGGSPPRGEADMRGQMGCPGNSRTTESLRLPLGSPSMGGQIRNKSPSSPSLSGVFNTSYPATNSLQSMSPLLSPLCSELPSPQLNHRILLLPDEAEDEGGSQGKPQGQGQSEGKAGPGCVQLGYGSSLSSPEDGEEPRVTTEVIDKNGNKRTITRLDLNLSRLAAGNSRWNSSSTSPSATSIATGE